MKKANTTSCCLKTPSQTSMGVKETTFANDAEAMQQPAPPINNNNKFHLTNEEKSNYQFLRKLAVNIKFSDVYYRTKEWAYNKMP
ncbi:hypothetical protein L9F63_021328, partial [Diploptera punctata]